MTNSIKINRAPVLTLWGVIVAERLGNKPDEDLTLGKVVAGLNTQSKGQRLGIYSPAEKEVDEKASKKAKARKAGEALMVEVVGRRVPVVQTEHGLRATVKGEEVNPKSVERYLEQKFGERLKEVRTALEDLAKTYPPQEPERSAYALYEQFLPEIPERRRGWGTVGHLNLERIRKLAKKK
ncbi:MAG: hypothetical protein A2Y88_10270 [Chloroflexi bacterium RBG_13_48_10]|nr:MAG: hypothetical protein A2Y88_10270 [Chloroflexi bacterium RBG_13_48_10]